MMMADKLYVKQHAHVYAWMVRFCLDLGLVADAGHGPSTQL